MGKAHVICIQSHNLNPAKQEEHERLAQECGFTLKIGYAPAGRAPVGEAPVHYGGTAILVYETEANVVTTHHTKGEVTRVELDWQGKNYDIASVYAPAQPSARVTFFTGLGPLLSRRTIVGGDWNCVPDVTLDVKSTNPLNYANQGATLLAQATSHLNLHDLRRDQLQGKFEATRTGVTQSGAIATRIDRWYVSMHADYESVLWDIHVVPSLVWSTENSDHLPVVLTIEPAKGERGAERKTVREELAFDPAIQNEILKLLARAYEGAGRHHAKWEKANRLIANYLLEETQKLKKRESNETKMVRVRLEVSTARMNQLGPTPDSLNAHNAIKAELFRLENPEAPEIASVSAAKRMTDRSDACTHDFFATYKATAKKQWINAVHTAEWKEGHEPCAADTHLGVRWDKAGTDRPVGTELKNDALARALRNKASRRDTTIKFTAQEWADIGITKLRIDSYVRAANGIFYKLNHTTSQPKDIPGELKKYYEMLFSEKRTHAKSRKQILGRLRNRRITEASAAEMDRTIEDEEVQKVMERLPLRKQAGPNRVPNAVYRCLSIHFAPKLAAVLRDAIKGAPLPPTMLQGDISLLYKKKDRLDPRNYRPLTMLNTDYKIYTKVLANRLKKVVHQFVSETQKGFVPDAFIAECSMLMNLIEAWINEEADDRKGLFLFLDMEKAFDRVSYTYLTEAMSALGFGANFRRAVGLMYDTERPPKRRIYANGYYSDWFEIKSGVAQGCPLSALLFLVVAEGLRISLEMESGFKGIEIGGASYPISQFADDTTLMMGDTEEIPHAERGLRRWCRATGMRENKSKREGLAMGKYRGTVMPAGTEWVKEGSWAVSLGVPIGNELDKTAWWKSKLEATREKSRRWGGLYRAGYFGRNLIVQSMYLGRLRYWLYSIPMPKSVITMVQSDADILWWSKEPKLGEDGEKKRFRRFVARQTAIGPRAKGGLGNVDWASHVDSFYSQWITRYIAPGNAGWKTLLDSMILFDKNGRPKFPTDGRAIVMCSLTRGDKLKLLRHLPKKATYIRECFLAHWRLKINLDEIEMAGLHSEPLWRNPRFRIRGVDRNEERFLAHDVGITKLGDVLDETTRCPRTILEWRKLLGKLDLSDKWAGHGAAHVAGQIWGGSVRSRFIRDTAARLVALCYQIPRDIRYMLKQLPRRATFRAGELKLLTKTGRNGYSQVVVLCTETNEYEIKKVDTVGKLHDTRGSYPQARVTQYTLRDIAWWSPAEGDIRVRGAVIDTFPLIEGWTIDGEAVRLDRLSIKQRTAALALRKMIPPACESAWQIRLPNVAIPWTKVWKIKSFYATPRDQFTWLRLMHRNLYTVGHRTDIDDNSCRACTVPENQLHLGTCDIICEEFWTPLLTLMDDLGFPTPVETERASFVLLGVYQEAGKDPTVVGPEQSGLMFIAWRCLYAEVVRSRVDERPLDLTAAYKRTMQVTITRLKAYGEKWKMWSQKNRHTSLKSAIPLDKQERKVIAQDILGDYTINPRFLAEFDRARQEIAARATRRVPHQRVPPVPPAPGQPPAPGPPPPPRQPPPPPAPRPIMWPAPTRITGNTTQTVLPFRRANRAT